MFRVITKNSVYTVTPIAGGFQVSRTASMWGQKVTNKRTHFTRGISLAVGTSFATDSMVTTPVLAVIAV